VARIPSPMATKVAHGFIPSQQLAGFRQDMI
jgi:hypothetical protein